MFSPAVQSLLCLLLLVVSATVVVQAAPTSISTTSASSTSTPISTPTSTISPLLIKNSITYCLHIIKGELQHQITDESGLVSYCVLKGGETKILAHVLYQSNRFAECEVDRYDCSSAISLSLSIPEQTSETEKCEEAYQHCYVQKHFFFYEEGYISKTNPDPVVEEFDDSIIRCMN